MLESLLISTGLPILLDLVKGAGGAISRKVLGLSVDDQVKLDNAQIERVKALAELDNPHGTPSQWVIDTRGAFRYIAAAGLVLSGIAVALYGASQANQETLTLGIELAASPFGFIFGERLVLSYKGGMR